ncbi:hypothetical protein L5515_012508 [Caenorhabditis briggsae]|uniref:Uncharacterized protein n=1 Tax=Caenorhabditis briggsae TaxID=6238 RepID=A0AAE9EZM7_CAEBR|nr:hypothetical protein L5515_012508 [Caenorhabditis briggsae]
MNEKWQKEIIKEIDKNWILSHQPGLIPQTPVLKVQQCPNGKVFLLIVRMTLITETCLQTIPGTTPSPTDCCPELPYMLTSSDFPDGTPSYVYNSLTCRTTVTMTCSTFTAQGQTLVLTEVNCVLTNQSEVPGG